MASYKICVDARMIFHSGAGTFLRNILYHLLKDTRFELTLIGNKLKIRSIKEFSSLPLIESDVDIYTIKEQLELPKLIKNKDFDLFFSPHYNAPIFIKTPLLGTILDVFHLSQLSFSEGPHKKIYAYLMLLMTLYKSKQLITISHFQKNEIIKYLKPSKKTISKINKITLGVSQDWIDYPILERPYQRPYILFVGNVKPHKNIKTLISAFIKIKDKIPHDLLIIGKKEGFITNDKVSQELTKDLESRIQFTGKLDLGDELFCQYFEHSDLFVFPSLYEGFGLPPLEAMARKTKVIVSDIPVLQEIFSGCAHFFPAESVDDLSELIIKVLDEANIEMIDKGFKLAKKHTWKKTSEEISQLMIETIESVNK